MTNQNHAGKYATLTVTNLDGTTVSYPVLVTHCEHSQRWGYSTFIEFGAKTVGAPIDTKAEEAILAELKRQSVILERIANHIGVGSSSSSTLRAF